MTSDSDTDTGITTSSRVIYTITDPYRDGLKKIREIYPDAIPDSLYDKFDYYEYHKYKVGERVIVATAAKKYDGSPDWDLEIMHHPEGDKVLSAIFPHAKKLVQSLYGCGYACLSDIAGKSVEDLIKEVPGFGLKRAMYLNRVLDGYGLTRLH